MNRQNRNPGWHGNSRFCNCFQFTGQNDSPRTSFTRLTNSRLDNRFEQETLSLSVHQ